MFPFPKHGVHGRVIAAAAIAGNAFADDITIDTTPFNSVKSRTEVQAELAQYKKAGEPQNAQ